jgi:putative spermidine/putrescine transport system permease protein
MLRPRPYATLPERVWHYVFLGLCVLVFVFLVLPLVVIVPLSFNAEPFFSFTPGMLALDPEAFSLRWYREFFASGIWRTAMLNSFLIGMATTALAVALGTLAALGLNHPDMPWRRAISALLLSPIIVPLIIVATGVYYVFAALGLVGTYLGVVLAHTVLATPFVVVAVSATLARFDRRLLDAAAISGASAFTIHRRITLPLIAPGIAAGAVFAFATSFDEVVVTLFVGSIDQQTLPRQMWTGLREQLSPTILAAATLLIGATLLAFALMQILRRRVEPSFRR